MPEIVNIQELNPNNFEFQDYSMEDKSLISFIEQDSIFNPEQDYLEYFIFNLNNQVLFSNLVGWFNYKIIDNKLSIDPEQDLKSLGFEEGNYNTLYNFLTPKLFSNSERKYFISQISPDRTEIRLDTTQILNEEVVSSTLELVNEISNSSNDFYLNFGNNKLIIANNVLLDNSNNSNPTVLIKLYEPLPLEFNIKSELWVVSKKGESKAYNISISQIFEINEEIIKLKGPNTNLNIKDQINNSTDYSNYNSLISTPQSQGSGSFQYQLNNLLSKKGININIDYSDYSNFIHFSSAQTRLENFYYKLSLIEQYTYSASLSSGTSNNYYISSSNIIYQNKINEIIKNFDNYEYYLYFNSGSTSWPKSNLNPPFINYTTLSNSGSTWFISQSLVAENFDLQNDDILVNSIPSYLREDPANEKYELFIEMIGQHFDNIFVYIQDVTNKYNADNRLNYGVSKDLVADILRDLGINIYQNNFSSNDLYSALLGFTNSGSLYNLPYTTGSLPVPLNYEYINNYITASLTSSLETTDNINKEIYKRIYHNLPYLLKKKGTVSGLEALINVYGIPDTILKVSEFGGKDKNPLSWDNWQDEFNYCLKSDATSSNFVAFPFKNLSPAFGSELPRAIEFRFKPSTLPSSSIPYSQSLLVHGSNNLLITLEYTGSGYTTGSYSGSIINPYYQYANLKFHFDGDSASVYLPFFNGDWWSVLVNANTNGTTTYSLFVKNKPINYYEDPTFEASSSFVNANFWNIISTGSLFLNTSSIYNSISYSAFTGSYQEFRYYSVPLSKSVFDDFVLNPYSIEGNTLTGSQSSENSLAFRIPLGGELYIQSSSIHPSITGSKLITQSFAVDPQTASFNGTSSFIDNVEKFYIDQVPSGIKDIIANKIFSSSIILPTSSSFGNIPNADVLSSLISIQQNRTVSSSYTPDINYAEIALSPQNEINSDINSQLGYFNIGDFIGDPRLISSSNTTYPELEELKYKYSLKYKHDYDIWNYIRLIKYFDNSLFKMLQDWVPARTSLAAGIVIKPTILERNKYPVPQPNITSSIAKIGSGSENINYQTENLLITGSSIQVESITGSNGGTFIITNIVTQSWNGSHPTLSGSVPFTQNTEEEFYDGEFSGSRLIVTTQSLNPGNPFLDINRFIGTNGGIELNTNGTNLTYTLSSSLFMAYPYGGVFLGIFSGSNGAFTTIPFDILNNTTPYYNTASYTFTPPFNFRGNTEIQVSASYSGTSMGEIGLRLYENGTVITSSRTFQTQSISTLRLNNFTFRKGFNYTAQILVGCIEVSGPTDFTASINLNNNSHWIIYPINEYNIQFPGNPNIYQLSENPNPYSEYDAILNNVSENRLSFKYFDVDYTQGGIIPINKNSILSGSAIYAQVQDSNYSTLRVINPRYLGSKVQSAEYNIYTGPTSSFTSSLGLITSSYSGDKSFGKTSAIDTGIRFGLYFNDGRAHEPELPNKTTFQILYMFDEEGNTYNPSLTESYYENMLFSYGKDTKTTITLREPALVNTNIINSFQGVKNVFFPLYNYLSPLTTQSGSGFVTSSIWIADANISPIFGVPVTSTPYWTTGSNSRNVLTASVILGQYFVYNAIYPGVNYIQTKGNLNDVLTGSRSGFGGFPENILPLKVNRYDIIRFNNGYEDYSQDYLILSSSMDPSIGTEKYYIFVDRIVTGSISGINPNPIDLNKFTILNRIPNQDRVFINVYKPPGLDTGRGFILPAYPSERLKNNFSNIIAKLSSENLL